jgi:hypothetical protein
VSERGEGEKSLSSLPALATSYDEMTLGQKKALDVEYENIIAVPV